MSVRKKQFPPKPTQHLPPALDNFAPSQPVDLMAPPWLLPPSAPPETLSLAAPSGSLVPPVPPWSVVALLPSAVLRYSSPMAAASSFFPRVSSHTDIAPVHGYSSSTADARHRGIAWVSSTSDVAQLHRSSVCTIAIPASLFLWLLSLVSLVSSVHLIIFCILVHVCSL